MLKRSRAVMPASLRREFDATGLLQAFNERPPDQRNDYLHWITRSVSPKPSASGSTRCWRS
ncbi:hypothetical protein ACFFWD_20800 [Bradyrhizobium erythrophlei]|uniref:hypothetical protein n=1 Tax=Bradyrhizobium erythrophlei TaxID=1437360 RepID=UPI0035EEC814